MCGFYSPDASFTGSIIRKMTGYFYWGNYVFLRGTYLIHLKSLLCPILLKPCHHHADGVFVNSHIGPHRRRGSIWPGR